MSTEHNLPNTSKIVKRRTILRGALSPFIGSKTIVEGAFQMGTNFLQRPEFYLEIVIKIGRSLKELIGTKGESPVARLRELHRRSYTLENPSDPKVIRDNLALLTQTLNLSRVPRDYEELLNMLPPYRGGASENHLSLEEIEETLRQSRN
jgi:hypothetical protein